MNRGAWRMWAVGLLSAGLLGGTSGAADEKGSAGKQQEKHFEKEVTIKIKMNYLLYVPDHVKNDRGLPLVLFLHGSGESGDDVQKVKKHGLPKLIEAGKTFPFIVVSPQSPSPRIGWNPDALGALLDEVESQHKVDKDRVYVTGLSMGGFGTWALAAAYPKRFAAIAPICGGGNPETARKLKDLPIWVFHGAKDPVVRPRQSERMVEALKNAGNKQVKLTMYPEAGHDSWTETYDNPKLYEWLLEHKRGEK
jgi:predicted peptidase